MTDPKELRALAEMHAMCPGFEPEAKYLRAYATLIEQMREYRNWLVEHSTLPKQIAGTKIYDRVEMFKAALAAFDQKVKGE